MLRQWVTYDQGRYGAYQYDMGKKKINFASARKKGAFSFASHDNFYVPTIHEQRRLEIEHWFGGLEAVQFPWCIQKGVLPSTESQYCHRSEVFEHSEAFAKKKAYPPPSVSIIPSGKPSCTTVSKTSACCYHPGKTPFGVHYCRAQKKRSVPCCNESSVMTTGLFMTHELLLFIVMPVRAVSFSDLLNGLAIVQRRLQTKT